MLSLTSLFLLIPLLVYDYKEFPPWEETLLATLIVFNVVFSILFWTNPVQHSPLHVYDARLAKLSYVMVVLYVLFLKDLGTLKWIFGILLLASMTLFYYSHVHSTQEWCSPEHVWYHAIFHVITSAGCSLAFL